VFIENGGRNFLDTDCATRIYAKLMGVPNNISDGKPLLPLIHIENSDTQKSFIRSRLWVRKTKPKCRHVLFLALLCKNECLRTAPLFLSPNSVEHLHFSFGYGLDIGIDIVGWIVVLPLALVMTAPRDN
jgi:hypothetical protein